MTAQRTRTATTLWAHLPALVKLDFQEMAKSAKVRNRYFVFFLFNSFFLALLTLKSYIIAFHFL